MNSIDPAKADEAAPPNVISTVVTTDGMAAEPAQAPVETSVMVSRFDSHHANTGTAVVLKEVIDEISNPPEETKRLIGEIRVAYQAVGGKTGKDAIRDLKAQLPAVTFSATGSRRSPEAATGLLCLDFDELGLELHRARRQFETDPHVAAVFVSPSGDGLKVLFRVPKPEGCGVEIRKAHRRAFKAVQNYVQKHYGLAVDPAASDLLRLCYLSYDLDTVLRLDAVELDVERHFPTDEEDPDNRSGDPAAKDGQDPVASNANEEVVEALLRSIPPHPSYEIWLRISAAVRNSLGNDERAIELLKAWSPEEHAGEYRILLESSPFSRIGFGTLAYHARLHGFGGVIRQCFYAGRNAYYLESRGQYIGPMSETELRQHLRQFGVDPNSPDCPTCKIRTEQHVRYVGPVAGYPAGLHEFNGDRFLVTRGPTIIEAGDGDGAFVRNFLMDLLGKLDERQYFAFLAWLQRVRRAVRSGRRTKIPALVVAGGRGDGKSLLIHIVKLALGGRSASAYRYLSGQTSFNGNLVGAELLVIDDDAAARDHTSRARFAQFLKNMLFAGSVAAEAKGRDAFECAPVQAVIIAVNNSPEHLRVLPELDESMRDKIMLLQTSPSPLPPGLAGHEDLVDVQIREDLPGFLRELEEINLSEHIDEQNGRLQCHWNDDLLDKLRTIAPEEKLLELAHAELGFFDRDEHGRLGWSGTAAKLEGALLGPNANNTHTTRTLLSWPGACGTYLGKLADDGTGRVRRLNKTKEGRVQRYWIAEPPGERGEQGEPPRSGFHNIPPRREVVLKEA